MRLYQYYSTGMQLVDQSFGTLRSARKAAPVCERYVDICCEGVLVGRINFDGK